MRRALFPAILMMNLPAFGAVAETLALKIGSADVGRDDATGAPTVLVTLQPESAAALGVFTSTHVGQQVRLKSGDEVLSTPFILEPILGGKIVISGNLTPQSARDLVVILRGGGSDLTVEADDR